MVPLTSVSTAHAVNDRPTQVPGSDIPALNITEALPRHVVVTLLWTQGLEPCATEHIVIKPIRSNVMCFTVASFVDWSSASGSSAGCLSFFQALQGGSGCWFEEFVFSRNESLQETNFVRRTQVA